MSSPRKSRRPHPSSTPLRKGKKKKEKRPTEIQKAMDTKIDFLDQEVMNGIFVITRLQKENKRLTVILQKQNKEIKSLKAEIKSLHSQPFEKELQTSPSHKNTDLCTKYDLLARDIERKTRRKRLKELIVRRLEWDSLGY